MRDVLYKVQPKKRIMSQLIKNKDVEISEADLEVISNAVAKNDIGEITKVQKDLYAKLTEKYKGRKGLKPWLDRVFKIQKACMLSAPATIARGITSNVELTGLNWAADWVGNFFTGGIKEKGKRYKDGQFNLLQVKISDNTKQWIKNMFFDNKFYDMINEGLTRYDARAFDTVSNASKSKLAKDPIVEMLTNHVITEVVRNNTFGGKGDKVLNFIFKAQSDDPFIKKSFAKYLGKIIESKNIDITKGYTKDVMDAVAVAYNQAAYDYVHRDNFIHKFEGWLRHNNPGAYAGYKLIFPFASSSWNWFKEAMDLNPVALGYNIYKLIRLEKQIEKGGQSGVVFCGSLPRCYGFSSQRIDTIESGTYKCRLL